MFTPATASSWRPARLSRTASIRCCAAPRSASFALWGSRAAATSSSPSIPIPHCSYVIEVNPRVSRSSALASKATGYPIARVAAKIAVGLRLDEIENEITGKTVAAFEPALDYCVVKIPRWPFDKFPLAERVLGTQMKATGEVMAIDRTFEAALQKAMRSLELRPSGGAPAASESDAEVLELADQEEYQTRHPEFEASDDAPVALLEALRQDDSDPRLQAIHADTGIDRWFLAKLRRIVRMERELARAALNADLLLRAKRMGFSDRQIAELSRSGPLPGMTSTGFDACYPAWGFGPSGTSGGSCPRTRWSTPAPPSSLPRPHTSTAPMRRRTRPSR